MIGSPPDLADALRDPRRLRAKRRGFHLRLRAEPMSVRQALSAAMRWMGDAGFGPIDRGRAEIVLAEVLNNITEHAYGGGTTGDVDMAIDTRNGYLDMRFRDRGRPMPFDRLPRGTRPDCDVTRLPEGGFGWYLIRQIADNLVYCNLHGQNCLNVSVSLKDSASG